MIRFLKINHTIHLNHDNLRPKMAKLRSSFRHQNLLIHFSLPLIPDIEGVCMDIKYLALQMCYLYDILALFSLHDL